MTAKAHVRNLQNKGQYTLAVGNKGYTLRYGVVATRHGKSTTKAFYRNHKGKITKVGCAAHSVWSTKYSAVKLSRTDRMPRVRCGATRPYDLNGSPLPRRSSRRGSGGLSSGDDVAGG